MLLGTVRVSPSMSVVNLPERSTPGPHTRFPADEYLTVVAVDLRWNFRAKRRYIDRQLHSKCEQNSGKPCGPTKSGGLLSVCLQQDTQFMNNTLWKISDIPTVIYGEFGHSCEPTQDDIRVALQDGKLESRGYQSDRNALYTEWSSDRPTMSEFCRRVKEYHARRIAYFVKHGWTDPIQLSKDGKIEDGLHRLKAAIFIGKDSIEVTMP